MFSGKHTLSALGPALLATCLCSVALQAQEPGVPVTQGEFVALCYGEHTAGAVINGTGDLDQYFFFGAAGDRVRIHVRGQSIGLDPRISLRDPFNNEIATASCSANDGTFGNTCGFLEVVDLPFSGPYQINVDEVGNTQTGSYILNLERVLPTTPEPYLIPGVPFNVVLGHQGDHDYLRFVAEAGSEVLFVVSGQSIGLDSRFQIFDDTGSLLHEQFCNANDGTFGNTCTFSFSAGGPNGVFDFPGQVGSFGQVGEVRRYMARITDVGLDQTGTTRVTMNCVFSPSQSCPLPQPTFGPVGSNYCASTVNSTGVEATLEGVGSASLADDDFHLIARDIPKAMSTIFLFGPTQGSVPIGQGTLCLSLPLGRFPLQTSCGLGGAVRSLDMPNLNNGFMIQPGDTWNFQAWYRDNNPGTTSNLTDGLSVSFVQ